MSLIPSSATPFNLPLFNSVLAFSAVPTEEKNGENAEESEEEKGGEEEEEEGQREKKQRNGEQSQQQREDGAVQQQREDGAVQARDGAVQARDGAVQARDGAVQARDGAVQARDGAVQARDGAVQARDGAVQARDGAVQVPSQGQQQHQHMDIPTIAFQLFQQTMFRSESIQKQQNRENEKLTIFGPSAAPSLSPSARADDRFAPQRVSNATKPKKSAGTHSSSTANGRRSANKSSISAAATAALMAPSPFGALPAIPGALAVAASPAAQLFREDDWSWHRNPAAAIRSGGTNKQTPVWKYFVYNKTENLSRCIVGTCTYQLKGPHTSTLACHLKKHAAEYAEFQRLKNEYTRERMVNGQTSSGSSAGGERSTSARSTPFGGHCSSVGILPNGIAVGDDCSIQKSRSPSVLSDPYPPQCAKSSNASSPVLSMLNTRFPNCAVLEDEPIGWNLLPRGMLPPVSNHPPSGDSGIFGAYPPQFRPLGGHPPPHHFAPSPFQHFLIAAAAMAGQNNGMRQQFTSPPPQHLDYSMMAQLGKVPKSVDQSETNATGDGVGQGQLLNQRQNSEAFCDHAMKRDGTVEGGGKGGTCGGGTGANLLDILNLLSKRAEAAALREKAQNKERERRGGREAEDDKRKMIKRKYPTKRDSDEQETQRQWAAESIDRKETVEGIEEEDEVTKDEGQTHLNHSVEHILKDGDEKEEEELAKKKAKMDEEEKGMNGTEEKRDNRMEEMKTDETEKEENVRKKAEKMRKNIIEQGIRMDETEEEEKMMKNTEEMEMEDKDDYDNEKESAESRLSPMDRLALFLGTAFPPPALRHLMKENQFLRHFCSPLCSDDALTYENVDKLLDNYFARMKDQIRQKLARIRSSFLLVDIRCGRCWRFRQNAEELEQPTDECQCQKGTTKHSLCTVTLHHKKAGGSPILLAMRRIEEEEKWEETDEVGKGQLGKVVEQILSDFFSVTAPLCPPSPPSLLLVRPPFLPHFPSSVCSIPCLPAVLPHCLQKRLLAMLSKKLPMRQMSEYLAKDCPHKTILAEDDASVFPSSSTDKESAEALFFCANEMIKQQTTVQNGTTEFEREPMREIIRLHEIITGKSYWKGTEEMDDALSAIRTENFGTMDGFAERIDTELSKAAKALHILHKCGVTDIGCLKNAFNGPFAIFGSVIEGETEWTERSAMLLFNGDRRKEEANNDHE